MVRGDTPYLPAMNATDSPLRTECSTHGRELAEAAGEKKRTAITEKKPERTDKKAKRREKGTESPPSIRMLYRWSGYRIGVGRGSSQ
jgi:hypothetical protein